MQLDLGGRDLGSLRRLPHRRVMTPVDEPTEVPAEFRRAVDGIRAARPRPEVVLEEVPAPQRLAPHAVALSAIVRRGHAELAGGRLVVLHDPNGQPGWDGTFRIVAYVRADLEPEIVGDPLFPSVGWTWLTEALEAFDAAYVAVSGTVTRTASESFGGMAGESATSEVELRASWTPRGVDLRPHAEAWCAMLCSAAGLPPAPPDVASLPPRRKPDVG